MNRRCVWACGRLFFWMVVLLAVPAFAQSDVLQFGRGSLVIPEQANLQTGCGITSAYGLVWRILQSNQPGGYNQNHPVTIFWAVNGSKSSPNRCVPTNLHSPPSPSNGSWSDPAWNDGCDLAIHNGSEQPVVPVDYSSPLPSSGVYPDATVPNFATTTSVARPAFGKVTLDNTGSPRFTDVQYQGGPFLIASKDVANVLGFLRSSTSADIKQFTQPCSCSTFPSNSCHYVQMHQATADFSAHVLRQMNQVPPKFALLDSGSGVYTGILDGYLQNAGLNFTGAAGCPAGTRSGCSLNGGKPGQIYDQFNANEDLISSAGHPFGLLNDRDAHNRLVYKVFWTPHWVASNSNYPEYVANGDGATDQRQNALNNIAHFADQEGTGLMAECASLESYEGSYTGKNVTVPQFTPETQFLFSDTIQINGLNGGANDWPGRNCTDPDYLASPTPRPACMLYPKPGDPYSQIGDLAFMGVYGHVHNFKPNWLLNSTFDTGDSRLVTSWENYSPGAYPGGDSASANDGWDFVDFRQKDNDPNKATILYLAGHTYDDTVSGNRIVLNTLMNLGVMTSDVSLSFSGPTAAVAGASSTYNVSVSNAGPSDAIGVEVKLPLPSGATAIDFTGSGSEWSCALVGTDYLCDLDGILSLGASTSGLLAKVTWSPATTGSSRVDASASSQSNDPNLANNSGSVSVAFSTSADLSVNVPSVGGVLAGTPVTLAIFPTNAGPSNASAVTLTETFPAGFTNLQPDDANGWSCTVSGNTQVSCTRASLGVGESAPLHVNAIAPPTLGTFTVTTSIASRTNEPNPANNSASTDVTVTASTSDLAIALSGPTSADATQSLSYTAHIANGGPSPALDVAMSIALPGNATVAIAPRGSGWSCAAPSGGTVSCTLVSMLAAGGTTPDVTFVLTPPADGGSVQVSVTASSDAGDPNLADNTATVTTAVSRMADVAVALSSISSSAPASSAIHYLINAANRGPSTAGDGSPSGVTVSATLPGGFTLLSTTAAGWTCAANGGSGGTVVTCTVGTLPVGAAPAIELVAKTPAATGSYAIDATIQSTTADPSLANNHASLTTTVGDASSDLAIAITGPATASAGELVSYAISVANEGPSDDDRVQVGIPLPAGVGFDSASGDGWSCAAEDSSVVCSLAGVISYGQSAAPLTVTLTTLAEGGTETIDAQTAGSAADPAGDNNVAEAVTQVGPRADVSVTLQSSSDQIDAASGVTYTIGVANAGPSTAQDVAVDFTLPTASDPTTLVLFASGDGWTCSNDRVSVHCSAASLPVGSAPSISVQATSTTHPGSIVIPAQVASTTADPAMGNNRTDHPLTVNGESSVSVVASGPVRIGVHAVMGYQVVVENGGDSVASGIVVTGQLPAGTGYLGAGAPGWSCDNVPPGNLTCILSTPLLPGASADFEVKLTAPGSKGDALSPFVVRTHTPNGAPAERTHASVSTRVFDDTPKPTPPSFIATGGGCNSSGGSGPLAPLALVLLGLGFFGRRSRLPSLRRIAASALAMLGSVALAETTPPTGIDAQRFRPGAGAFDLLNVESARVANGEWHVGLLVHAAQDPLELRLADTRELSSQIVSRQITADLTASVGFGERFELGLLVPYSFQQTNSISLSEFGAYTPSRHGLGDIRVTPKLHLYGEREGLSFAVSAPIALPTAGSKDFLGQSGFGVEPRLVGEFANHDGFRLAANVGVEVRQEVDFMNLRSGTEFTYGLGGEFPVTKRLTAQAALTGGVGMTSHDNNAFDRPLELLAALRWAASDSFSVQLGGGPGLTQAYGTPSYRLLLGVGWTAPFEGGTQNPSSATVEARR